MISARAKVRADLIRRLFAVIISVGFAASLVQMEWVKIGAFPDYEDAKKFSILLTALLATVASWDGYLVSIETKPLNGTPRYFLDLAIVFVYLYMLLAANHYQTLLPTLCIVFSLYIVWDILSIFEHRDTFSGSIGINGRSTDLSAAKIYLSGVRGDGRASSGPTITLYWTAYFFALYAIFVCAAPSASPFAISGMAALGLVLYREDKIRKYNRPVARPIVILSLAAIGALVFCAS